MAMFFPVTGIFVSSGNAVRAADCISRLCMLWQIRIRPERTHVIHYYIESLVFIDSLSYTGIIIFSPEKSIIF